MLSNRGCIYNCISNQFKYKPDKGKEKNALIWCIVETWIGKFSANIDDEDSYTSLDEDLGIRSLKILDVRKFHGSRHKENEEIKHKRKSLFRGMAMMGYMAQTLYFYG